MTLCHIPNLGMHEGVRAPLLTALSPPRCMSVSGLPCQWSHLNAKLRRGIDASDISYKQPGTSLLCTEYAVGCALYTSSPRPEYIVGHPQLQFSVHLFFLLSSSHTVLD